MSQRTGDRVDRTSFEREDPSAGTRLNSSNLLLKSGLVSQPYRHVAAVHSRLRTSCLSHDSQAAPSFLGFRNLMVLVLAVKGHIFVVKNEELTQPVFMNLRLVVENFMKYGVLICIRCHDYRRQDLVLAAILYALVPCHLFIAYVIELSAARYAKDILGQMKKTKDSDNQSSRGLSFEGMRYAWRLIAFAHSINATLCLLVTSMTVFYFVHHPAIGTICMLHAIIVWLKNCSYAFTNRDLRHAMINQYRGLNLPETYTSCPYPQNISLENLSYFWWAPTLVYQPVYPRSPSVRWVFVIKRLAEVIALSVFIWLASAQYASPLLKNSLNKIASMDITSILERLMKLSTVSLIIWLAGFFAIFQSLLNALAEIMRFGDREFYRDWWNSPSVGVYWRTWNKPVYHFMRRHVYSPLIGRGWKPQSASIVVFVFSGVLHEMLVGIPTHNIIGVAFMGMVIQIPLIAGTLPLEKMQSLNSKVIGNCIFWISFVLIGQPLAALLYFFAWQAKYGTISRAVDIN